MILCWFFLFFVLIVNVKSIAPGRCLWKEDSWEPTVVALRDGLKVVAMTTVLYPPDANQSFAPAIAMRVSEDQGKSWGPSIFVQSPISQQGGQADPVLAAVNETTVVAAWMNGWFIESGIAQSFDKFSHWKTVPVLSKSSGELDATPPSWGDKPWVVAGPNLIAVTFNSQFPYVSVSTDGGLSYATPVFLAQNWYYYYFAGGGAALEDGSVGLAYTSSPAAAIDVKKPYGQVQVFSASAQGKSWQQSIIFNSSLVRQPCPQWAGCDDADFLGLSVAMASGSQSAFVSFTGASDPPNSHGINDQSNHTQIANAYVSWTTNWIDWSAPVQISPPRQSNHVFTAFPAVTVCTDNLVVVGWYDNDSSNGYWNVWIRVSRNGGKQFGPPQRLSGGKVLSSFPYQSKSGFKFPFGDYWALSCTNSSNNYIVHAVWGEGDGWFGDGNTFYTIFLV